jgi:integrase
MAKLTKAGMKSFFAFHDITLPFRKEIDRIDVMPKKVRTQRIPNLDDIYRMADLAQNERDRAIVWCLAQSGVRVSCLCRWDFSMVKNYLYPQVKAPIPILITAQLDHKILRYGRKEYTTFLSQQAAQALREWCDYRMRYGWKPQDSDALFVTFKKDHKTPTTKVITRKNVWTVIKTIARKARMPGVWVHLIRKSFDNIVTPEIPFAYKEALMGHNLPGSSDNYHDWNDTKTLQEQYESVDWTRNGISRISNLEQEVKEWKEKYEGLKTEVEDRVEDAVSKAETRLRKQVEQLMEQIMDKIEGK